MARKQVVTVRYEGPLGRVVTVHADKSTYVYPFSGGEVVIKDENPTLTPHSGGFMWRGLFLGRTPQKEYVQIFGRVMELTPQLGVTLLEAEYNLDEVSCGPPEEVVRPDLYVTFI